MNTTSPLERRPAEIVFRDESYSIMGACFEVYKEKGCGFLKCVYQECLAIEFALQQIPVIAQVPLALRAYPKAVGDCPNFAESSEQNGTVPLSETVLG